MQFNIMIILLFFSQSGSKMGRSGSSGQLDAGEFGGIMRSSLSQDVLNSCKSSPGSHILHFSSHEDSLSLLKIHQTVLAAILAKDPYVRKLTMYDSFVELGSWLYFGMDTKLLSHWARLETIGLKSLLIKLRKKAENVTTGTRQPEEVAVLVQTVLKNNKGKMVVSPTKDETKQDKPAKQDTASIWELYGHTCPKETKIIEVDSSDCEVLSSSSQHEQQEHGSPSSVYYDHHKNCLVRLFPTGQVEMARMEAGPQGFMAGVFSDGTKEETEVPNDLEMSGKQQKIQLEGGSSAKKKKSKQSEEVPNDVEMQLGGKKQKNPGERREARGGKGRWLAGGRQGEMVG